MRAAIITSSDSGYAGKREDVSGPVIAEMVREAGYEVVWQKVLPDDQAMLEEAMKEICDEVLGYNKVIAKPEAEVPVTVEGDPFIAFASYGKGRSGVVTTDCAPHWAPPEFCEWEYYNKLWQNIADWLIQK